MPRSLRIILFRAFLSTASLLAGLHVYAQHTKTSPELFTDRGDVLFAKYAKIPLVPGHGSYFKNSFKAQSPLPGSSSVQLSDVSLEILDSSSEERVRYACPKIDAYWSSQKSPNTSQPCSKDMFLTKVWSSAKNQAQSGSCLCVSKSYYRDEGASIDGKGGFPRPGMDSLVSLRPLEGKSFDLFRPDGSAVETSRLDGIFAQDLGPGPVDLSSGSRARYVRLFKMTGNTFSPLSSKSDTIYQITDGGLFPHDIRAETLADNGALLRADGSKVGSSSISHDMWLRPSKRSGADNEGLLYRNQGDSQKPLNADLYTAKSLPDHSLFSAIREPNSGVSKVNTHLKTAVTGPQTVQQASNFYTLSGRQAALVECAKKTPESMSNDYDKRGYCAEGVQRSLQCAYGIPNPPSTDAYEMVAVLVNNGFTKLSGVTLPTKTPAGCINVYDSYAVGKHLSERGSTIPNFPPPKGKGWKPFAGHIEVVMPEGGPISDFVQQRPGLDGVSEGISTLHPLRYYKFLGAYCKK